MKCAIKALCVLGVVMLVTVSCDEVLDQLNLDFESGPFSVDFVIDTAKQGDLVTSFDVVYHDAKQEIENKGGDLNKLDLVQLKSAPISLVSGASNLNAFESFSVYIETQTITEKEIASVAAVPLNVIKVDPTLTSDNLKKFFTEGEYTITLKGVLREDITQEIDLEVDITFIFNL